MPLGTGSQSTSRWDRPCSQARATRRVSPCVTRTRSGWSSREDALEEGAQTVVDILDRLAPAPSDLGDVQALGGRLGHQLTREATLEEAQALLTQGDVLFDGHPEDLRDHLGCLRGPDQVTAEQTHSLARGRGTAHAVVRPPRRPRDARGR